MDNDKHVTEEGAEEALLPLVQEESESEVHRRIVTRCDELWSWWLENIEESNTDRDMVAGLQWSPESLEIRKGRVTLVANKLPQYVESVMGDILQNPTNIKYRATSYNDGSKVKGKKANAEYEIAEIRSSAAKDIEIKSNAQSWYERAARNMCEGAFGWLRVDAVSDDYGRPQFEISGVMNPADAMIDCSGIKPDWSDARDGFIFTRMPIDVFKKTFPGKATTDFSASAMQTNFQWSREQYVLVAEYWERVRRPQDEIIAERNVGIFKPVYQVFWRRLSGNEILEGGAKGVLTPFSSLPAPIPMIGSEVIRGDGSRIFQSVHRHARDLQKDANYWRSGMTQQVAMQASGQPWVGTATMFEDNKSAWETANVTNPSMLAYKVDPEAPQSMPTKAPPPDIPAAAMQLYLTATQDLQQSLGIRSDLSGTVKGEESGRAILAKERQDQTGKYGFTKGRDAAIQRVGKLLQEGMKRLYGAIQRPQEVRMYNSDETIDYVEVGPEAFQGDYECYVEAGPSYATQRIEGVNTLMGLAESMPNTMAVGADILAANLDSPVAKQLSDRLRRAMDPRFLSPNERAEMQKEQENEPPAPPDPNLVLQSEIEKARAAAAEARVMQEQLKTQQEELQAQQEALKLQAEQANQANAEQVKDLVAQALAEFLRETNAQKSVSQIPGQQ
jgi:hypothetical protein